MELLIASIAENGWGWFFQDLGEFVAGAIAISLAIGWFLFGGNGDGIDGRP